MAEDQNDKNALERYLSKRGLKPDAPASRETPANSGGNAPLSPTPSVNENDIASRAGGGEFEQQAQSLPRVDVGAPQAAPQSKTETAPVTTTNLRAAGFWIRVVAALIDWLIVTVLHGMLNGALFFLGHFSFWASPLVTLVIIYFYYGYFYATKRASPGKMAMAIEIEDTQSAQPLNYWRTFFRETVGKAISGALIGIGYLMVAFRNDKRGLHDLLFDTHVVRK